MVIGHTDCGVQSINSEEMIHMMLDRGISQEKLELMRYCGIDFERWLSGFDSVEQSVADTVQQLRSHPLIPEDVAIAGFVMDSETGALTAVTPVPGM